MKSGLPEKLAYKNNLDYARMVLHKLLALPLDHLWDISNLTRDLDIIIIIIVSVMFCVYNYV